MAKEKGPFVSYTTEQVLASEAVSYVIYVGREVFSKKGQWVFDKKSASMYHRKILKQIVEQINNGTPAERRNAKKMLSGLKILPLRIQ